jgi:hypothetical protein
MPVSPPRQADAIFLSRPSLSPQEREIEFLSTIDGCDAIQALEQSLAGCSRRAAERTALIAAATSFTVHEYEPGSLYAAQYNVHISGRFPNLAAMLGALVALLSPS